MGDRASLSCHVLTLTIETIRPNGQVLTAVALEGCNKPCSDLTWQQHRQHRASTAIAMVNFRLNDNSSSTIHSKNSTKKNQTLPQWSPNKSLTCPTCRHFNNRPPTICVRHRRLLRRYLPTKRRGCSANDFDKSSVNLDAGLVSHHSRYFPLVPRAGGIGAPCGSSVAEISSASRDRNG